MTTEEWNLSGTYAVKWAFFLKGNMVNMFKVCQIMENLI